MDTVHMIARSFVDGYKAKTPAKLKVIDCFLVYAALTCAAQLAYMLLVGSFPFNSFLSGLFVSAGFFVLTACLRMQLDPATASAFSLSPQRALADYALCGCLLLLTAWNFMG